MEQVQVAMLVLALENGFTVVYNKMKKNIYMKKSPQGIFL